jgi:hypothetical protein
VRPWSEIPEERRQLPIRICYDAAPELQVRSTDDDDGPLSSRVLGLEPDSGNGSTKSTGNGIVREIESAKI